MAIRAVKVLEPIWFTPRSEKDADQPAQFLVAGLTGSQQAQVGPELTVAPSGSITFSVFGIQLLFRYGLRNWRGIVDDNDAEIDMQKLKPREVQDLLPYQTQVEVAAKILNLSWVGPADKKK